VMIVTATRMGVPQNKTFQILNRILDTKIKDSNIFKLYLNWSQTKINLNNLF
jgi:hypothetical protein